jgi:hypothetical protein
MRDIGYICDAFMSRLGSDGYYWHDVPCSKCPHNPNCDVTGPTTGVPDWVVNMRDIGDACNNYIKPDP